MLSFGLLLLGFNSYAQSIRYVKTDDGRLIKDGRSWATAYDQTQLQTAVNELETLMATDKQVWVAAGTYKPTTSSTDSGVSFAMKNDVAIYGGFPSTGNPTVIDRNPNKHLTTLSGAGINSYHVISNNNVASSAMLDGFVITGGYAGTYDGPARASIGGGMLNVASSPTINNCVFRENFAALGGAVGNVDSSPTFFNCVFTNNRSLNSATLSCSNSSPKLVNCTIANNYGGVRGVEISISDGANTPTTLINCIVWEDYAINTSLFYSLSLNPANQVFAYNCLLVDGARIYNGMPNNIATTSPFISTVPVTDLRLKVGSQAIDKGSNQAYTSAGGPILDPTGNVRIQGAAIDQGAYEYQSNSAPIVASTITPQSATVGQAFTLSLASTFTDTETPSNLSLSVSSLPTGVNFVAPTTISGVPSTTIGSPFSVTVTATDPGGLSASTNFLLTIIPAIYPKSEFNIATVTNVSCLTTTTQERYVTFYPVYAGNNGSPINFSVVNEMLPTTYAGPYSLRLYTDNPVITLVATQSNNSEARFIYNWLTACQTGFNPNRSPITNGIPDQTLLQNQPYQLDLTNYLADPDGQSLTYLVSGLPAGLTLNGGIISGSPSATGVSSVTITAFDPDGLSLSVSFRLQIEPTRSSPSTFSIVGVSTVNCEVISSSLRRVTFIPQYAGITGEAVSFSVVNEKLPTPEPGPYWLNLYTDNPTVTLSARQGNVETNYSYSWLAICNSSARLETKEAEAGLQVTVLGNPIESNFVEIVISGVIGQALELWLIDQKGRQVYQQRIEQAGDLEQVRLPIGSHKGILLLSVQTHQQQQQTKILVK